MEKVVTNGKSEILSVSNLGKRVATQEGELQILKGVGFSINKSESVAVIGASGSGKSTLLGLLAGLDTSTEGEIHLCGKAVHQLDEDERAKLRSEHVGFVFQSFQLLPGLNAVENVMLPLELGGVADAQRVAESILDKVGLSHRLHHSPRQLSGGEQQRVAIARAFVSKPDILFADEPTGNLDHKTGLMVADLLFELNESSGTTLILVTHDEKLAERCDRRLVLEEGQLKTEQLA